MKISSVYIPLHNLFHVMIHCYQLWCAVICVVGISSPDTVFRGYSLTTLLQITQTAMMSDVVNSATGMVRSNTITTFIQILSRVCVAWMGDATHFRYLAIIWSISDITRYAYHVVPKSAGILYNMIEWARYNQYVVLYPMGVTFENISLLPIAPHVVFKAIVVAIYAIFFPRMFNHTSKLRENIHIIDVLTTYSDYTSDDISDCVTITYKNESYVYTPQGGACVRFALSDTRFNWKSLDKMNSDTTLSTQLQLRDYGIQVSWRLVYIVEYAGALLAYPLMVWYGGTDMGRIIFRPDVLMWVFHYTKRVLESIFIHSFSSSTMPFENIFKNSLYYWGAGWVLGYMAPSNMLINGLGTISNKTIVVMWCACQIGNLFVHNYLANLRIAPDGSRITGHVLPNNMLFRIVVCPNYGFEVMGWLCFALLDCVESNMVWYVLAKSVFCIIGAVQMYMWAGGKKRRYKRLFGDKYKTNNCIFPFV